MTDRAEDDLAEIWSFIAETSPEMANAFVRRIEEKFEPLRHHPEIGPRRDNLAPGLRAHFSPDYVIYYQATQTVLIIRGIAFGFCLTCKAGLVVLRRIDSTRDRFGVTGGGDGGRLCGVL